VSPWVLLILIYTYPHATTQTVPFQSREQCVRAADQALKLNTSDREVWAICLDNSQTKLATANP